MRRVFLRGTDGKQRQPPQSLGYHYPGWAARDFYDAGVTVGATADNHSLDRHEKGVDSTLKALAAAGIVGVGTSPKREAAEMKKGGALRPNNTDDASPRRYRNDNAVLPAECMMVLAK